MAQRHAHPSPLASPFLVALTCLVCGAIASPAHGQGPATGNPSFELRAGERYFRVGGEPSFVLGRNPVGMDPQAYDDHFRNAVAAGERFMRIHFTYSPPNEKAGEIDEGMLRSWDVILDSAERNGVVVLPVLGVWADWNDGSNKETWHSWDRNAFNASRGGPATRPAELFEDSACRALWLKRLETFVKRWSSRRAIVGWETFSELDLVTGAQQEQAVAFVERAAAVIRAADLEKRPITASQAGVNEWPLLIESKALDFIEVHPYANASAGQLDDLIIRTVRQRLKRYGKPVLIGECGLSAAPPRGTLDVAPRAEIGIRHAIWASIVSGAMNGRALWWQDGYDQFEKADLCRSYNHIAVTAAGFVRQTDLTGFVPADCEISDALKGAIIGNSTTRLGWFRDVRCIPPEWPVRRVSGQQVSLAAPGDFWQVEFTDPATGQTLATKGDLRLHDGRLIIPLPEFQDSIAFRLTQTQP